MYATARIFESKSLALIAALFFGLIPLSHADVVLDWNALMIDAIRADNSGPTLSSRNLAILHAAIYDAVNSVLRTHQPYKLQLDVPLQGKETGGRIGDCVSANFFLANETLPLARVEGFQNRSPLIRVHGHIGRTCILEASTDFVQWQSISTNQAVVGGILISDTRLIEQAFCFYRVREK